MADQERRKHARFASTIILQYKDGIFTAHADAVTKDMGLGGICFFSEKKLRPGRIIQLRLFYDGKAPARLMKGKITWSKESNELTGKGYLNGVVFLR